MIVEFVEATHEYFLKTSPRAKKKTKLISVTQLMQKHGLAPSYEHVDADVLESKAKRGTMIHQEIEAYNKTLEVGFTEECNEYIAHIEANNILVTGSEKVVFNDIVAGTVDLMLHQGKKAIIADIKTTSTLHKDAISWQLSIYKYLSGFDFDEAQAYHFDKDGRLRVVDIPFKPVKEVEKLLDCERKGEIYKQDAITLDFFQLSHIREAEELIAKAEEYKARADAMLQEIKDFLVEKMEEKGIKTFETDAVKITYVAPSTRTTLDSKRIKDEMPDVYKTYSKESETKASVRIKLK